VKQSFTDFSRPLFCLESGMFQCQDYRDDDDCGNEGFRYSVYADDSENGSSYGFYGDALGGCVRCAYQEVEGTEEEDGIAEGTAHGCDTDADTFGQMDMFIKEVSKESDADTGHDADESIVEWIVLQGELEQKARCAEGLEEGEETKEQAHDGTYFRSCHDCPDNGRDVKDGSIHDDQGNETVTGKSQEDGDSCQKAGNGEFLQVHKCAL